MPTETINTGRLTTFTTKEEATFNTAPSGNWTGTHYYSSSLAEDRGLETDPLLGGGLNNARDASVPAPSLIDHGGQIELPLDLNHIGYWLKYGFGAPVTTGGGADKTHTFTSGAAVLPSFAIEQKTTASEWRQHLGLAIRELRFDAQPQNGFNRMTASVLGVRQTRTASAAGTPTYAALQQFARRLGVLRVNSVQVGKALSANLVYRTGLAADRYLDGSANISAIVPETDCQAEGEITLRYTGPTIEDLGIAETSVPVELEFQISATKTLILGLGNARFGPRGPEVQGPGGLQQRLRFMGHQTAAAAMMTAVLKNQVVSY